MTSVEQKPQKQGQTTFLRDDLENKRGLSLIVFLAL